jgi:hypothetical protein
LRILEGGVQEDHDENEESLKGRRAEELMVKGISPSTLPVYWGKHKHTGFTGNFC